MKVIDTNMDPPKVAAYHIVISSVHGSVLNSSSYRPGIPPDYVQKYMTKQTIPETESESKTNDDKETELHQDISFESSLHKIKDISQEVLCSENLKECSTVDEKCIDTQIEDVNESDKEVIFVLKIISLKGKVLETSVQCCDTASPVIQEYPKTQRSFVSSQKSDERNEEKKSTLRDQFYLCPKRKNMTVEQDTWFMNQTPAENSYTDKIFFNRESQNVKNSIEEVICVKKIIGCDGNVLETSVESCDQASPFLQEYLSKQHGFRSSRKSDQWKGEQKVTFRKHVHLRPESERELKTEYMEVNNYIVGKEIRFVNQTPAENSDTENRKQITNNSSRKRIVIIWVICLIGFPRMAKAKECQESLSTVTLTPSCPTTEKQWTEKALLKKCPSHSQSCSSSSDFVYHCLVNEFGNATIEVCAPKIRTSYCVEFNILGARIQANFHSKCSNTTTDCGRFYNSNEMYKVPQCYSSLNEHSMPNKLSETTIPHPLQSTTSEIETTDSYTTINQTEDSRYADKSNSGADKQWGNTTVGLIMITTFILIFVLPNTLMILKKKKLKTPFHQRDIEAAENITQELIS